MFDVVMWYCCFIGDYYYLLLGTSLYDLNYCTVGGCTGGREGDLFAVATLLKGGGEGRTLSCVFLHSTVSFRPIKTN